MNRCHCDPCRCADVPRDPPPRPVGPFGTDGDEGHRTTMRRLGVVMEPDPARPEEAEGVLNPGAVRGRDGQLYLFPRLVGRGNYSWIGRARVVFDRRGDPVGVERLGTALEPRPRYERQGVSGGCEDPRITYFRPLDTFLMTYVAVGPHGPRIALAVSRDLERWHRKGRVDFRPDPLPVYCTDFDHYNNKDGLIFPEAVPGPDGRPSLAILHRPVYETATGTGICCEVPCGISDPRASIWISYIALEEIGDRLTGRLRIKHHHCIAEPAQEWENYRIGGGAPPVRTRHGWLLVYHGVEKRFPAGERASGEIIYRAGVMLLDREDPRRVLYRSKLPVLEPSAAEEREGVVANVVFPTGLDIRDDIGEPDRVDVYYGMADARIGVATFSLLDIRSNGPQSKGQIHESQ